MQLLVEMRGRGFMGVQLEEIWDGAPMLRAFMVQQQQVDEQEEVEPEAAPDEKTEGKARRRPKVRPNVSRRRLRWLRYRFRSA